MLGLPAFLFCLSATLFSADLTTADRDALLAQRAGFGRLTTGGYTGPVVHVTTDADAGPGSLREAVSGNDPRWIVFDGDFTIRLSKGIEVGSHKTIDGRNRKVTLTGHGAYGLLITDVSNVMVENLILHDFGDIEKTKSNDPYDALHIEHASRVWIDHCDLSMAGDKLVSVGKGSTEITVSWTHFHDQEQVFQIGSMSNQDVDTAQTVTSHHNYFNRTGYRHPVISYGRLHAYNNYLCNYQLYGIRSERTAQAYIENNIFESDDKRPAIHFKPAGKGENDNHTLQDARPGSVKLAGNLCFPKTKAAENEPEKVFSPSDLYEYKAEPATRELALRIAANAGWRPPPSSEK
jgi:pectate lyase